MSGLCANAHASLQDFETTKKILLSMGSVLEFDEIQMDAVTAMSGSGPAYCFYLAESMIAAGISLGFTEDTAAELTLATLKGALELLDHQKDPPDVLRHKVTSPGGTTEAAIRVLEDEGVKASIIKAIQAAARRSEELSA
jgi:pyrroline-5-carboxylate reductase